LPAVGREVERTGILSLKRRSLKWTSLVSETIQWEYIEKKKPGISWRCTLEGQEATVTSHKKGNSDSILEVRLINSNHCEVNQTLKQGPKETAKS